MGNPEDRFSRVKAHMENMYIFLRVSKLLFAVAPEPVKTLSTIARKKKRERFELCLGQF